MTVQKAVPGFFGWKVDVISEAAGKHVLGDNFKLLRGSPATRTRTTVIYSVLGLIFVVMAVQGFGTGIYWRLQTGQWWRDPSFRSLPIPPAVDSVLNVHTLLGSSWVLMVALQVTSGSSILFGSSFRRRLRALHSTLGRYSPFLAYPFFFSTFAVLAKGLFAEPIADGWNSPFSRTVQLVATLWGIGFFVAGIYHATLGNIALHKDLMAGCVIFSVAPVAIPRFFRDILQSRVGTACNVSKSPEVWFLTWSLITAVGWPFLFAITKRFSDAPRATRRWCVLNVILVVLLLGWFRPVPEVDLCPVEHLWLGDRSQTGAKVAESPNGSHSEL